MSNEEILLVYDQECPACHNYSRLVRIRESVGRLTLVNAREESEVMKEISSQQLDIDQGMVLKMGDQFYYGADAIHVLALISSRSGLFNKLNYWVFRSQRFSAWLYPALRFLRNLLLKTLGKTKINNLNRHKNSRF